MLTRIVEPLADWVARVPDGLVQATGLVYSYGAVKVVDYIVETEAWPPGALYVAGQDGTVLKAAPADFVFLQQWAGWEFPAVEGA